MSSSNDTPLENPLAIWHQNFKKDVHTLRELLLLRTRSDDSAARDAMAPTLNDLSTTVSQLEEAMATVRIHVASEQAQLAKLRAFRERVAKQKQRIALIEAHMPKEAAETLGFGSSGKENDVQTVNILTPDFADSPRDSRDEEECDEMIDTIPVASKPGKSFERPSKSSVFSPEKRPAVTPATTKKVADGRSRPRSKSAKARAAAAAAAEEIEQDVGPIVRAATSQELADAPQYVKGRLTLEKVEAVAKKLTEIAERKYALLARPKGTLSTTDHNVCDDFREAECDETDGMKFLTDAEIKGFGKYRLDSTAKSVINVLRHIGSLKEIRGKNRCRVFIIN